MKIVTIILSLILSLSSFAASEVLGPVPTITIGGVTIPAASAKVLQIQMTAGGVRQTMYVNGSAYSAPTNGIRILSYQCISDSASAQRFSIGYGDNAVDNSGSNPTNAVVDNVGTGSATANTNSNAITLSSTSLYSNGQVDFTVPSGKYPYVHQVSGASNLNCSFLGLLL